MKILYNSAAIHVGLCFQIYRIVSETYSHISAKFHLDIFMHEYMCM